MKRFDCVIRNGNIYAPNKDKDQIEFYRKIKEAVHNRKLSDYIIIGET